LAAFIFHGLDTCQEKQINKKMRFTIFTILLLMTLYFINGSYSYIIDSFPATTSLQGNWSSSSAVTIASDQYYSAPYSMVWADTVKYTTITRKNLLRDWSTFTHIEFYVYSAKKSGSTIYMTITSENSATPSWDYYYTTFKVDWEGTWKRFFVKLSTMTKSRTPLGWNAVDNIQFYSVFSSFVPSPDTKLYFDDIKLVRTMIAADEPQVQWNIPAYSGTQNILPLKITSVESTTVNYTTTVTSSAPSYVGLQLVSAASGSIASGATINLQVKITLANGTYQKNTAWPIVVDFKRLDTNEILTSVTYTVMIVEYTPNAKVHPYLLGSDSDRQRLKSLTHPDAKAGIQTFLTRAEKAMTTDSDLTVPKEGGGWTLEYICEDGTYLTFDPRSPNQYYCPSSGTYYQATVYPDRKRAWIHYMHDYLIDHMVALSFSYYMNTTKTNYAQKVRGFLLDFASIYSTLPIRDTAGSPGTSGGRLTEQTLDESMNAVNFALCYDFVYNTLSDADKAMIEWNLLRALIQTIRKNNPGKSNWQSYHNSAHVVVGLAVNDDSYVTFGVDTIGSGAKWQIQNSLFDDGVWYESSFAYHMFTLSSFISLSEPLLRNKNINLYTMKFPTANSTGTKSLEDMFTAPIKASLPNLGLPDINDSVPPNLKGQGSTYEIAKARYPGNMMFDYILTEASSRGTSIFSLFAGYQQTVQDIESYDLPTSNLPDLGLVSLRSDSAYLAMDYGPHGDWHGHYDKLNVIFYAQNQYLLKDPASVAYSLDIHTNYFKASASHNTLMINGHRQLEAQGTLEYYCNRLASANSNEIYPNVSAKRVLTLLPYQSMVLDISFAYEIVPAVTSVDYNISYILHGDGTNLETLSGFVKDSTANVLTDAVGEQLLGSSHTADWTFMSQFKQYIPATSATARSFSYKWNSAVQYTSNFDTSYENSLWKNVVPTTYQGNTVGLWDSMVTKTTISWSCPPDWSQFNYFAFTLTSTVNNGAKYTLLLYSENDETDSIDYYSKSITINFTGTRTFNFTRSSFTVNRSPVGFHKIDSVQFSATGWGNTPMANSVLYIDNVQILRADGTVVPPISNGMQVTAAQDRGINDLFVASAPSPQNQKANIATIERRRMTSTPLTYFKPFVHIIDPYVSAIVPQATSLTSDTDCLPAQTTVTLSPQYTASGSAYDCSATGKKIRVTSNIQTQSLGTLYTQYLFNNVAPYSFEGGVVSHSNNVFAAYGLKNKYKICQSNVCFTSGSPQVPLSVDVLSSNVTTTSNSSVLTITYSTTIVPESNDVNLAISSSYTLTSADLQLFGSNDLIVSNLKVQINGQQVTSSTNQVQLVNQVASGSVTMLFSQKSKQTQSITISYQINERQTDQQLQNTDLVDNAMSLTPSLSVLVLSVVLLFITLFAQ
jgi:hypothetical protein